MKLPLAAPSGAPSFKRGLPAAPGMTLPMAQPHAQPVQAKFVHENGTHLRLQCFLAVRDEQGRVATMRVQGIDGWCLPGETMLVNESPDQAAVRVARMWFQTPLGLQLDRILSFPATGPGDDRWYLIFIYHADAPAGLQGTSDTEEIVFRDQGKAPEQWAMSHHEIWPELW